MRRAESIKQKAIEAIDISEGYNIISANINRFNSFLLYAFCFMLSLLNEYIRLRNTPMHTVNAQAWRFSQG